MEVLQTLGNRIRELRQAADLSQRELAEAIAAPHSQVVQIEAGGPNITVLMLMRLSAALGVPLSTLFDSFPAGDAVDPLLAKICAELDYYNKKMDERRETVGSVLEALTAHLERKEILRRKAKPQSPSRKAAAVEKPVPRLPKLPRARS